MSLSNFNTFFRLYVCFVAFVFGTVMGSFLNCYAYRILHNLSIVKGRSKCGACGHVLGPKDLVPIFSYIFSKGRCRYCGTKLSPKYLISEVVSGLVFMLIVIRYGLTIETIKYLIFCSLMLCISFADLEEMIIPDRLIIFGLVNRLIFILIGGNIKKELISSLLNGLLIAVPILLISFVISKVLKKDAMGGGDIKLFFVLASYFNAGENLLSVLLSCFIGIAFSVMIKKTKEEFPFGPSICLAYFITMLVGSNIVNWYLGLFI